MINSKANEEKYKYTNNTKRKKQKIEVSIMNQPKKNAPILVQFAIFAGILFVSTLLSSFFPKAFSVPAAVIGTILLYGLLSLKIIKLEWVEELAEFFIGLIGFLFVPAGISLAAHLDIMQAEGLQVITVITFSTIILLVVVTYAAYAIIAVKENRSQIKKSITTIKTSNEELAQKL